MCIAMGVTRGEIDRFCCHPGGVKVIDAIESALGLPQGELNLEREVLHDHGNMSAPTVMFVLERLLERGLPDKTMMTAFGPGFHLRRNDARSCMIFNIVILSLVTLERLGSCGWRAETPFGLCSAGPGSTRRVTIRS